MSSSGEISRSVGVWLVLVVGHLVPGAGQLDRSVVLAPLLVLPVPFTGHVFLVGGQLR